MSGRKGLFEVNNSFTVNVFYAHLASSSSRLNWPGAPSDQGWLNVRRTWKRWPKWDQTQLHIWQQSDTQQWPVIIGVNCLTAAAISPVICLSTSSVNHFTTGVSVDKLASVRLWGGDQSPPGCGRHLMSPIQSADNFSNKQSHVFISKLSKSVQAEHPEDIRWKTRKWFHIKYDPVSPKSVYKVVFPNPNPNPPPETLGWNDVSYSLTERTVSYNAHLVWIGWTWSVTFDLFQVKVFDESHAQNR